MKGINNIFFWLLILFISNEVKSQNCFNIYNQLDFNEDYIFLKKKVDKLLENCEDKNTILNITDDFSKRIWQSNLTDAISYVNQAIKIVQSLRNQKASLSTFYFRRGYFNYVNNDNPKALDDYKKVIELNSVRDKIAQSYCEIGRIHSNSGDFFEAIRFYKEGIRILKELKDYGKLINQSNNLAIVYDVIGEKSALKNKLDILQYIESLKTYISLSYDQEVKLNTNFALLYTEPSLFNFEKAKQYHFKNLARYKEVNDLENPCFTYANLADLYNIVGKDSAKVFIEKGMLYCKDSVRVAKYKHQLSTFLKHKKKYSYALDTLQSVFNIVGNFNHKVSDVQNISVLKKSLDIPYLIAVLIDKAKLLKLRAISEKNNKDLILALKNSKLADELLSHLQKENREKKSKFYWRSEASKLYTLGVSIARLLNDYKSVFYFMEKNKAILLVEGIKENVDDKLPKKLKQRKQILQEKILRLEDEESQVSEQELFQQKQQYQKFIDSLKVTFPIYGTSKNQTEIRFLSEIQRELDENTAVVSYIWNRVEEEKPVLFGTAITKTQFHIFEVKKENEVARLLGNFRKGISKPFETIDDRNYFQKTSYELYQLLFPSVELKDLLLDKKLIIIPDGQLQQLPFEALITNKNTNQYVIQQHQISYAYSASFLMYNASLQRKHKQDFIGFSPVFFSHSDLNTLKNSAKELESIHAEVGGTRFVNDKASKSNFLGQAPLNRTIHLATHADASSNPWIAFHDSKLEAYELYVNKIPAELVVLSGCDTSLGEISQGEGVMSLSRGFFHAGANTVAATLWNVNDKSTATIMTSFYKNLKKGQSKATALHHAKLNYLQTAKPSEVAPYYWAPMILMGDGETVLYTPLWIKLLYALAGLLLFTAIVFYLICRKGFYNRSK